MCVAKKTFYLFLFSRNSWKPVKFRGFVHILKFSTLSFAPTEDNLVSVESRDKNATSHTGFFWISTSKKSHSRWKLRKDFACSSSSRNSEFTLQPMLNSWSIREFFTLFQTEKRFAKLVEPNSSAGLLKTVKLKNFTYLDFNSSDNFSNVNFLLNFLSSSE